MAVAVISRTGKKKTASKNLRFIIFLGGYFVKQRIAQ